MPRRLVQQGVEQRRLAKAPDAGDPADVLQAATSAATSAEDSGHGGIPASNSASGRASTSASGAASGAASLPASRSEARHAGVSAGAGGPARRRGRPRGPERVALNVRIRRELDDRLTAAVDQTGQGPQDLVERALEQLLDRLARAQRHGGASGQGQGPRPQSH